MSDLPRFRMTGTIDPPQQKALAAAQPSAPPQGRRRRASVYVHFPWCLAKCPYCDFVSYATPRDAIDHVGYADAVLREVDARAAYAADDLAIGSVFFGGG